MLAVTTVTVIIGGKAFFPAENIGAYAPECGTGHSAILAAQAVPSAALLPCVAALPSGWRASGGDIVSGRASFWLDSDQAGPHAATITLAPACDTAGAREIPSDQPGMRRFERPISLEPQFSDLRFYTFPGGCVTYRFRFPPGVSPVLAGVADTAVSIRAPVEPGPPCPRHRGSRPVRTGSAMSGMSPGRAQNDKKARFWPRPAVTSPSLPWSWCSPRAFSSRSATTGR